MSLLVATGGGGGGGSGGSGGGGLGGGLSTATFAAACSRLVDAKPSGS